MKQTEIKNKIPPDWVEIELGKLVDEKRPVSYGIVQTGEPVEGGSPCIRVTDITDGKIDTSNLITTSQKISEGYKRTLLKKGDLVMALRGKIGQIAKIGDDLVGANLTRGVALIALKDNYCNDFILQQISSDRTIKVFERSLNGSALQELSIGIVRKIPILLPKSITEQQSIARILKSCDKVIETTEKLISQKELRKKWLMQQLLTGKKRLKGFSGEWKKCNASDFLSQRNEQAPNNGNIPLFSLTIENGVTEKSDRYEREFLVKDKSIKNYKIVYPNDIVFNPANLRWGAIAKHTRIFKVLLSPIYEVLSVKDGFDIDFISYLVSSPRQISYYASILEGTLIERMAVKVEPFLATKYDIPEKEEQAAIAQVLKAADKEITLLKSKAEKLREKKKGLMQQLLTGKIRIK
jgi:type I restriction enzyme S subunit